MVQSLLAMLDVEADLGLRALDPELYLLQHLRRGLRLDGRTPESARPLQTKRAVVSGQPSAMIRLGDTVVVAMVRVLVGTPGLSHPDRGDVTFDVSILSERLESRSKTRTESDIEALLHKLVER